LIWGWQTINKLIIRIVVLIVIIGFIVEAIHIIVIRLMIIVVSVGRMTAPGVGTAMRGYPGMVWHHRRAYILGRCLEG